MAKKNIQDATEQPEPEMVPTPEPEIVPTPEPEAPPAENDQPPASGKVTVTLKIEAKGFYKVEADTVDLAVAHVKETPIGEFMDNVLKVQVVKVESAG
jgi:hypothetical protein